MKKDTLYLIIAALGVYLAWRTFRLNKQTHEQINSVVSGPMTDTEPETENETIEPSSPSTEQVEYKVTVYADCPYCGTPHARITYTFRNGKRVGQTVACGNKSCPGESGIRKASAKWVDTKAAK